MSLINFAPIQDGDEASDDLFNVRFAAILDLLNGGLDGDNLASNAVSTPKLVDSAVTTPKIANNAVTHPKMDVTRLTTAGKNGGYCRIGNVVICWGRDIVANAGTTINFPVTYQAAPTVTATIDDVNNQTAWLYQVTTTSVILRQLYTPSALAVMWIAIGTVA